MDAINRMIVHQRISRVFDTVVGAQGTPKIIKDYVKDLRKAVGLKDESVGDANDFLRDFGKGI